ncbi:MAG: hypothetical protein AAB710_02260 [Patescibacteria group bacterium]
MKRFIEQFDETARSFLQAAFLPIARLALFIVFFWFGFLKIIQESPANPLVEHLLSETVPFISFQNFILFLGLWEMLIGVSFLVKGWERFAIALLAPHMVTTFLPLVVLPSVAWLGFLIPTLEGQYIIKNTVIIALAIGVAAQR